MKYVFSILVVDDEPHIRAFYAEILSNEGHVVTCAKDGKEALSILENNKFDLITLDLNMPVMDGYEFLKELQKNDDIRGVPIMVTSGYSMDKMILEAYSLGVKSYYVKSLAEKEFVEAVTDAALAYSSDKNVDIDKKINSLRKENLKLINLLRGFNRKESEGVSSALEEVEKITAPIVHDIKNNALFVSVFCDNWLGSDLGINRDAFSNFLKVIKKRMKLIVIDVNKIRFLSSRTIVNFSAVDINKIILESVSLLSADKYKIDIKLDDYLPRILGDDQQLSQLVSNIMQNSMQSMPEGGEIMISTYVENDRVVLEIADTGCGIPEDVMGKIFEINYTTKKNGYGLGLYLVKNIADSHRAKIDVKSKPGIGTNFKISFQKI